MSPSCDAASLESRALRARASSPRSERGGLAERARIRSNFFLPASFARGVRATKPPKLYASGASPFLASIPGRSRAGARRGCRDGVRAESAAGATTSPSKARGTAFALSSPSRGEREAESRLTARPGP